MMALEEDMPMTDGKQTPERPEPPKAAPKHYVLNAETGKYVLTIEAITTASSTANTFIDAITTAFSKKMRKNSRGSKRAKIISVRRKGARTDAQAFARFGVRTFLQS